MIVDRYYYHQLNKKEQYLYRVIYDGVKKHEDVIPLPVKGLLTNDTFYKVFNSLTLDNPLMYFLNQTLCKYGKDEKDNYAVLPQYFFTADQVKKYNKKVQETVNNLVYQLKLSEGSDYDKEKKVHDWICRNVVYDIEGMKRGNIKANIASHSIIGVFAYHKAQCEGIAKAFKVLLNTVNVRCIVINGFASGNGGAGEHSWNIVNIDNTPYQVDVTWDVGLDKPDSGRIRYDYFNVTDKIIRKDHQPEKQNLPICNCERDNYFCREGIVFKNKTQIYKYIEDSISSNKDTLYFRYDGKTRISELLPELINLVFEKSKGLNRNDIQLDHVINDDSGTCWLRVQ